MMTEHCTVSRADPSSRDSEAGAVDLPWKSGELPMRKESLHATMIHQGLREGSRTAGSHERARQAGDRR